MNPTPTAPVAAPTSVHANDADALKVRVIDASTGETIEQVIAADADAGTVSRYAVNDGHLVREGNVFAVIEEQRAIRIEWIDAPSAIATEAEPA